MIFAFFLNIILNPVLCFGFLFIPALGVKGIAYSTVFVELLTIFYLGYHVLQLPMMKNFKISNCSLNIDYLIDFLKQSVPASLNMLMIAVGFFVIQKFVNVYGSSAAAAYGIALRIEQIILLPSIGLNIALLSIVGQNYGAGNFDRIEKSHFEAIKIGIGLMTIGAFILFFFGDFLVKFFTKDPEVIAMADSYLFMAAFLTIIYQFIHMTGSVFQGLKKPMYNTIYTFFRLGALPPFVYHFYSVTLAMGLKGIWWGIFSINLVFAVMIFIHIRKIIVGLKSNKIDQIQTSTI
jgi:putative MATE family efflux protein